MRDWCQRHLAQPLSSESLYLKGMTSHVSVCMIMYSQRHLDELVDKTLAPAATASNITTRVHSSRAARAASLIGAPELWV
jgi:hypothetical protein